MMQHTRLTRRMILPLIALTFAICLPSCELPTSETADAPSTSQINPPDAGTPVGAMIHRIDMPLDVSLDDCWALVDEQTVPVLMHGMWEVNGLRVGILHAEQASDFADVLPDILGESQAKLFSSHYPTAVRSTPRVIEPVTIDITAPPRRPTLYRAQDGRLQLLARIGRSDTGQAFLELTPHHYKQKADLIPRSPLEKQLDGHVFTTLSLMLPIKPDTAIVVGLYRPWPEIEDAPEAGDETAESTETLETNSNETPTDPTPEETDTGQPTEPIDPPTPQPPAIPDHLGRSLMTGTRAGHPNQILMVISLIEEEPAGNAN